MSEISFYARRCAKSSAPECPGCSGFCRKIKGRMKTLEPHPLLRNPHAQTLVMPFLPPRFPRLPRSVPRDFEPEPGTRTRGECPWQADPRERPTLVLLHG